MILLKEKNKTENGFWSFPGEWQAHFKCPSR